MDYMEFIWSPHGQYELHIDHVDSIWSPDTVSWTPYNLQLESEWRLCGLQIDNMDFKFSISKISGTSTMPCKAMAHSSQVVLVLLCDRSRINLSVFVGMFFSNRENSFWRLLNSIEVLIIWVWKPELPILEALSSWILSYDYDIAVPCI